MNTPADWTIKLFTRGQDHETINPDYEGGGQNCKAFDLNHERRDQNYEAFNSNCGGGG